MDSTDTYQCGEVSKTYWDKNIICRKKYTDWWKTKNNSMYFYVCVCKTYCWFFQPEMGFQLKGPRASQRVSSPLPIPISRVNPSYLLRLSSRVIFFPKESLWIFNHPKLSGWSPARWAVYYSPTPLFYNDVSICLPRLIKYLRPYLILPPVLRDTEF